MEWFLQAFLLITLILRAWSEENTCSRIQSRVANSILQKSFLSIMGKEGLDPEPECLLRPDRSIYWDNERHKHSETFNNWNCLYCGKSFYNEKFLDKHFSSRHRSTIKTGPQAVCLADHCDYLRCDVISNVKKSSFWDEALCKPKELEVLHKKCENTMKMCIPSQVTGTERYRLLDELSASVCSYLTCELYWENNHVEASPQKMAAYIIAAVFTVFGFVMYYTLACQHLYSDDYMLTDSDGLVRQRSRLPDSSRYISYPPSDGQAIRSRMGLQPMQR